MQHNTVAAELRSVNASFEQFISLPESRSGLASALGDPVVLEHPLY